MQKEKVSPHHFINKTSLKSNIGLDRSGSLQDLICSINDHFIIKVSIKICPKSTFQSIVCIQKQESGKPSSYDEVICQFIADLHQSTNIVAKSKGINQLKPTKDNPLESKIDALERTVKLVTSDKNFVKEVSKNKDRCEDMFAGLKMCIQTNPLFLINMNLNEKQNFPLKSDADQVVDIILLANQFIFEVIPEIIYSEEFEKQVAKLIPDFIENLGSPKAIVRKSTHKCIGTYVKLTKKLESVLKMIIKTGLENQNSRTRQHSMLVLPALLSLKSSIVEQENADMHDLIQAVVRRIQADSSEIVSKTGKKLLLELQKCYSQTFKSVQIDSLPSADARAICYAVLANDEAKLKELLAGNTQFKNEQSTINSEVGVLQSQNTISVQGSQKYTMANASLHSISTSVQLQPALTQSLQTKTQGDRPVNKAGRDIMNNAGRDIMAVQPKAITNSLMYPTNDEKEQTLKANIPSVFQRQETVTPMIMPDSKYPIGENGLYFGFLNEKTLKELEEDQSWKERTAAIEYIDDQLNYVTSNPEKVGLFLPHISSFLGLVLQLIKDINFKISLTAINITRKILSLDMNCFNRHKTQLTTSLIEKLSDSKVVIRQSVLKCCGFIIHNSNNGLMAIAYHSIGYLQHTNWHVREGILYLLADCIITQGNVDELNAHDNNKQETLDPNHFAFNTHFISEMCTLAKIESKSKIQQMAIDCLSLCLEISPNRQKTEQIMLRELGVSDNTHPDYSLINQIKQRQNRDYLPALQLDGTVEFKPPGVISDVIPTVSPRKHQQENSVVSATTMPLIQQPDKSPSGAGAPPSDNQHYMKMRYQQQRIQQQSNEMQTPSVMLPQIKQSESVLSSVAGPASPTSKKFDVSPSPYAQMLEHNKKHSITAIKDQSHQNRKSIEHTPLQFQTPDHPQMREPLKIQPEQESALQVQQIQSQAAFARGPTTQSVLNAKHDQLIGQGLHSNQDENMANNWVPQDKSHYAIQKQMQAKISSSGTVDDGRSIKTTATLVSSQVNNDLRKDKQQIIIQKNQLLRSGMEDSQFPGGASTQDASIKLGYTPENHQIKPRQLFSNEAQVRQRTLDGELMSQTSKIQNIGNSTNKDFISIQESPKYDQKQMTQIGIGGPGIINSDMKVQQRNMSQSSGAPEGFNLDKTQINKRLQLLKSTFKYKNASEIDQNEEIKTFDNERIQYGPYSIKAESEHNSRQRGQRKVVNMNSNNNNFMLPVPYDSENIQKTQTQHNSFGITNLTINKANQNSTQGYKDFSPLLADSNQKQQNLSFSRTNIGRAPQGPVKATDVIRQASEYQENLSTLHFDDKSQVNSEQNSILLKHQISAPPLPRKPSTLQKKTQESNSNLLMNTPSDPKRTNSHVTGFSGFSSNNKQKDYEPSYQAPEEPFTNPENVLKQCLENLKSEDWQSVFDSCNNLKRLCIFHKDVIQQNLAAKDIIKGVVKHTDSMRSQIAKNSCMTLETVYSHLPQKELDSVVDLVLTALLKKATDTNHFVSEQADKALDTVCHACTESKVFTCLQMIPGRGALQKQKTCNCYTHIINKLGNKIGSFREVVSLIKTVVNFLSEGSQEVRNAAKLAILSIHSNLESQKEFDALIMKCGLSERQLDQTRKIVDNSDIDQLAHQTKYSSMRGSSLDQRGNSDIFKKSPFKRPDDTTQTSFNAVNSYSSPGVSATSGFAVTDNNGAQFKKRGASVSKPIDPQVYEQFRSLVDQCMVADWNKRLEGLCSLNAWVDSNSTLIKNNQQSKFIQLVDVYCKLIQDHNAKVQSQAISVFQSFLANQNLRVLIDSNLTLIVQAITHNMSSQNNQIRVSSEQLLEQLEQSTQNINQIVHPLIAQINLPNKGVKPQLLSRLILMVPRLDTNIIERQLVPLTKTSHKLQQEASTNPKLREQLKLLESTLASQ